MTTRTPVALHVFADTRPSARAVAISAAAAALAVVAAEAGRIALEPILNDRLPYTTFFPAVAVAAWAGGLGAGLLATALALALVVLPFPPYVDMATAYGVSGFVLFALGATLISALGGNLHAARERAVEAAARADFLAAASAILARRLDPLGTVEGLARVAVPAFADWCAIDLLDENGRFDGVRIAHGDPEKVALGYRLRREHPLEPDAAAGPPAVVRSGRPEFIASIPRDYAAAVEDPALRDIIVRLDLHSYICVPLAVHGRTLGTLTVFMSESHRRFGPDDLATATDLASRAAVAIDHARLYRRVRARGEELNRVIASMEEGVIVADGDGRVRSHNPAADRILGGVPDSMDEVLGRLVPAGEVMRVPATGHAVRLVRSDVDSEGEASGIVILRDVTDVLESQAARDTFVGMLSHEIRTPITTIFGTSQVLLRPIDEELRIELTRDLATETDRLYRLVEDLLVLSRYEREALDIVPEPVLLQRLIPTVATAERQRWPGIGIALDVEPDLPPVVADQTYIEQVVRNLVSNAAKYGGPSASIRLRARADGERVTVEVADDGPGIPEGAEETIFHLYERLPEARRSAAPGAGIGLFVCRRLVELMGGTISARNGEDGGAVIAFSLPVYGDLPLPVASADPGRASNRTIAPPTTAPVVPDPTEGAPGDIVRPRLPEPGPHRPQPVDSPAPSPAS